ncbi:hypothetical protein [Sellimonas intestinalis]|uniref:hypothetical protein n=1 Tax=Sellimonas intestinalis TaxID=1653434 RepID=UPI00399BB1DB
MPYIKTTCKAGKTKEYEFYYSYRFDQKGGAGKEREQDSRSTETSQPEDGREKLTRLMNANLSGRIITLHSATGKRSGRIGRH